MNLIFEKIKKLITRIVIFSLLIHTSCENESQDPIDDTNPISVSKNFKNGFFVVNEGNFSWGKATLSFIHQDGKVENNIYEKVNNKVLGNVGQSMSIFNDKGYIVVNNSQKVEVVFQCNWIDHLYFL